MCIDCINTVFQSIVYILAIILLIVLIAFVIKGIKTLAKMNQIIEDLEAKSQKLDGVFTIVDRTTHVMNSVSDKAITFVTAWLTELFTHNKKKKEEDLNE